MSDLRVTLLQADLAWENKEENLNHFSQKILKLKETTDIIVMPEMFTTGFSMNAPLLAESMEENTVKWMREMALKKDSLLVGSFIAKDQNQYFNRLIAMKPDGMYHEYDKRHLFAMGGEDKVYSAGNKNTNFEYAYWSIQTQVCYDLRFPVWSRNKKENMYEVLIYVANWPEIRSQAWKQLLIARAIENQCYVVAVNRVGNDGKQVYHSGDSMVVDPMGNVIFSGAHKELEVTISLSRDFLNDVRSRLPFLEDGDSFQIS